MLPIGAIIAQQIAKQVAAQMATQMASQMAGQLAQQLVSQLAQQLIGQLQQALQGGNQVDVGNAMRDIDQFNAQQPDPDQRINLNDFNGARTFA